MLHPGPPQARKNGGKDDLHNLVYACLRRNRGKGFADPISFNVAAGAGYMDALLAHLKGYLLALGDDRTANADPELARPAA